MVLVFIYKAWFSFFGFKLDIILRSSLFKLTGFAEGLFTVTVNFND